MNIQVDFSKRSQKSLEFELDFARREFNNFDRISNELLGVDTSCFIAARRLKQINKYEQAEKLEKAKDLIEDVQEEVSWSRHFSEQKLSDLEEDLEDLKEKQEIREEVEQLEEWVK